MENKQITLKDWLLLLLLGVIWGFSFILIKRGLAVFSFTEVACLRITLSAIAFLPLFFINIKHIKKEKIRWLVLSMFSGTGIPVFLVSFAQSHINSSIAGVLNSMTPIFTLIWGILFFRQPLVPEKTFGVLLGFIGAAVLVLYGKEMGGIGSQWYALLVVMATMFYGLNSNIIHRFLYNVPSIAANAFVFIVLGIFTTPFLLVKTNFIETMKTNPDAWKTIGYLSILALVNTVLCNILFMGLIKRTNPIFGTTVAYLIPIVAVIVGAFDKESIGVGHILGISLILIGVYLANRKKQ